MTAGSVFGWMTNKLSYSILIPTPSGVPWDLSNLVEVEPQRKPGQMQTRLVRDKTNKLWPFGFQLGGLGVRGLVMMS
uniref:Uncharacterized protein n=1 Tax=Timema bartmani TaxID=61472 RepID=A0A7R9ENA7_9NEOP|nr:unnamed protein product [Timema bartmani]